MPKRKADPRIAELEGHVANLQSINGKLEAENRQLRNQVEFLVRTLREIDDQIFKMTQAGSFEQMRPNLVTLQEGMTFRKVEESRRINGILHGEIISAYASKAIGKG